MSARAASAQAPLAQELKKLFANEEALGGARKTVEFHEESKKFFVNYLKQISSIFESAWNGRKYSIKSATALRAFIRVAPDVLQKIDQQHADRTDFRAIGRVISPWGRRIGALRFETDGAWKRQGTTVDNLTKELRLALQYPEGARGLSTQDLKPSKTKGDGPIAGTVAQKLPPTWLPPATTAPLP